MPQQSQGRGIVSEGSSLSELQKLNFIGEHSVCLSACWIYSAPRAFRQEKEDETHPLASTVLAVSAGLSFAQTTSGTSTSGTSTTTTMPSTTDQGTGATSSGTNMSGDQGTDTTTTSGTTNPNSARDCAPGQQTGSAQQAAPGQQDTTAKTAAPGQVKKTDEGC
ncbi:hypothetical protein NKH16_33695 [Mesorhizobium sp. M1307]|uniref:hypothetical protein n=1 Tax=Mesorhizobium sp. M1307 TaxID=2957079 RepID=UPI003339FB82